MSFDVSQLVQVLHEDPAARDALREALFGGDGDVQAALARLAEAQERTEARVGALAAAQERTEARVEALAAAQERTEARVGALAAAQERTEARVGALAAAQERTEARLGALAAAQERTEARLEALTTRVDDLVKDLRELAQAQQRTEDAVKSLVDAVTGMNDRLARLDGESLERRYRERGHAYFQRIAHRLRPVEPGKLSAAVDDARRDGRLTEFEAESLLYADAVFAGHSRDDDTPVHLVVEASVTISHHDVRRARERADLLARVFGGPVFAVVAGEFAPEPVRLAAQDADVWRVTNGRTAGPQDDDDDEL